MAGEIPPSDGTPPPADGTPPGAPPPADAPPPGKPAVRSFNCPACGAALSVTAIGQTVTVGCHSCGGAIDISKAEVELIQKGVKLNREIYIPIGSRGKMNGVEWAVIGVLGRIDPKYLVSWKEYLLYNPYQGFRWLAEADGHWNFAVPMKQIPTDNGKQSVTAFARDYRHFQGGNAVVEFVLGEFYWRVKAGDDARLDDYVSPPEMLSREKSATEVNWTHCIYVPGEEIKTAFKINGKFPEPVGIGPNQPSPMLERWRELAPIWRNFFLGTLALMFLHTILAHNEIVFSEHLNFDPAVKERAKVSTPFELKGKNNVEVEINAAVNNNYLDVDLDLVNEDTGLSYDMQTGAEYWSGYDSDGSWSEGSRSGSDLEPNVPAGKYHLVITPSSSSSTPIEYDVKVKRGVTVYSNFLFAFLLLSFFPIFYFIRKGSFESERWAASDHAPEDDGENNGSGGAGTAGAILGVIAAIADINDD